MATSTKLSFRARALDSNKAMCVYYASQLPDISECAPISRAVAQMPTGMEKEEEMVSCSMAATFIDWCQIARAC